MALKGFVREHVPPALVRMLSPRRRRMYFRNALRRNRIDLLEPLARHPDPFPEGALFEAIDHLLAWERAADTPLLDPLAQDLPPFPAAIWAGIRSWADDQTAGLELLKATGADHRFDPFERMSARAWSAFLAMRPLASADRSSRSPTLFQYWDSAAVPDDVATAMQGWQRLAGHNYQRFDRETARTFLRRELGEAELATFDHCAHPAIESDYIRLAWLLVKGGVYVDADSGVLPDTPAILPKLAGRTVVWFFSQKATGHFQNALIAAPPGAPLIANFFEEASRRIRANPNGDVYQLAGPGTFTDAVIATVQNGCKGQIWAMPNRFVRDKVLTQISAEYQKDERSWHIWKANLQAASEDPESSTTGRPPSR